MQHQCPFGNLLLAEPSGWMLAFGYFPFFRSAALPRLAADQAMAMLIVSFLCGRFDFIVVSTCGVQGVSHKHKGTKLGSGWQAWL